MTSSQSSPRFTGQSDRSGERRNFAPGRINHARSGFSLLDLVLVIGAVTSLAWFGIGGTVESNGRTEVKHVADYLIDVHRCQTEHLEQHGKFAERLDQLDLRFPPPVFFDIHPMVIAGNRWSISAVAVGPKATEKPTHLTIDQDGWVTDQRTLECHAVGTPSTTIPKATSGRS